MQLTARQQRALQDICETFLPAGPGWPSAEELGVPEALAAGLEFNPRPGDRARLLQLLDFWDTRLHGLLAAKKPARFSRMTPDEQARALLTWRDSRMMQRRAAFQALRKAAGFLYVMLPGADGMASPVWRRIGYPGPPGVQTPDAPRALRVTTPGEDTQLSCDVCVVGSGAGGATAAAVLANAGKDVVVLEMGNYYDDADFDGAELAGFQRLYAEAGFLATAEQSVGLLAGECVGGGTVVNYCTSFRTPDEIRAEWAGAGADWIATQEFSESLDAVCARLSVNLEHNRVSAREHVLERGLKALGWHAGRMPRNVVGCDQGRICGYCGYGCAIGAKQSAAKTWLADAQAAGARIAAGTRAERVMISRGAACGVAARTRQGRTVSVRCKAVIVACGAIHTPALLLRSGLRNSQIGRNLHLHPVSNVCGIFDEEIRPWEGTMQAVYSDEMKNMTGGFGVKFETTALQPVIASAVLPWQNPEQYRTLLEALPRTVGIGVLLRDRDHGRVTTDKDGNAVVRYELSEFDRDHLRKGFIGAARILEAAGARQIYSPHTKPCGYEPGQSGAIESFAERMDEIGWRAGQVSLFSFHLMGSARMGADRTASATNPDGETWEARNLYVMDGSSFPSASGVNPMISIEAIAHGNAKKLAQRLH